MAAEETIEIKKVDHANIFAAMAAFQGENIVLERTKEFGKDGDKMHFWYTPLDEVLKKVRPVSAKHGLIFTWEKAKEGESMMCCAVYHETYSNDGGVEKNVIRSMPIKVNRTGEMKAIGSDSTYARRYTMAEVMGLAPDEDSDVKFDDLRGEQTEKFAIKTAREGINNAKPEELTAKIAFLKSELEALSNKKVPSLGFDAPTYEALLQLAETKLKGSTTPPPGENGAGVVEQPK